MPNQSEAHAYLGDSPLVDLMLDWRRGLIDEGVALQRAVDPAILQRLDGDALAALSDRCVRWGLQGHWQDAEKLHRLLIGVYRANPERYRAWLSTLTAENLRVASSALWEKADHGVYARAFTFGEQAWNEVPDGPQRCTIAHELGIIHLDPYIANRDLSDLNRWWRAALAARTGEPGELEMPEPKQALDTARMWLERALGTAEGIKRLQTLKALLQIACSLPILGVTRDDDYVRRLLTEAEPLLKLARHRTDIISYLERVADAVNQPLTAELDEDPMQVDWEKRIDHQGIELVADTLLAAMRSLVGKQPLQAQRLAERVARIFDERSGETQRAAFYKEVVRARLGQPIEPPQQQVREQVLRRIAEDRRSAARSGEIAVVFGWIHRLAGNAKEEDAITLLTRLCEAAPELLEGQASAIRFLRAELVVGAAVNAKGAGDPDAAIQRYYDAWVNFTRSGFFHLALDMLGRIADLLPNCTVKTANVLCELIRQEPAPWAEDITDDWQQACGHIAATATYPATATPTADAWFAIARLAKGSAFANQFLTDRRYDWKTDEEARQLVAEIALLESSSDAQPKRTEAEELFENVLVSYQMVPTPAGGRTSGEQRDKLARRLDLHVRARLAELTSRVTDRFSIGQVQAQLPPDTVVLDLYFPVGAQAYGYCIAITVETVRLFGITTPDQVVRAIGMAGDTGEAWAHHSGFFVAVVRKALQTDPRAGQFASDEAARALAAAHRLFLGDGVEWLETQRKAGKRHLAVVPDGALHFMPFHLIGSGGQTLADTWTVTYLPSLDLLRRPPESGDGRTGAEVFGLGYQGHLAQPGLPVLTGAIDEANAVGRALNVTPVLEQDATPERVLEAMASARYVHVACHGEHDVVASSLQSLRLRPQSGHDGRLRTLDVLAVDTRGLSVLGLSACETALGRLDIAGNLLGISASALADGAGCVVGTLWKAADDASALFFSALFARLASGASRRDAFRHAQVETRRNFPEFRDWGAFYFVGHW